MMRLALLTFVLAAGCAPATPPADQPMDTHPVLVTVLSPGGVEPAPSEGLFDRYDLSGPSIGLTSADLAALPSQTLDADFPAGAAVRRFEGPALSAVLEAAGAPGQSASLTSIDGYQVEIDAEMIARYAPVLAIRIDGEPAALGGYGPAMLAWPRQDDPTLADMNDDLWIWGVFAVEAALPDATAN